MASHSGDAQRSGGAAVAAGQMFASRVVDVDAGKDADGAALVRVRRDVKDGASAPGRSGTFVLAAGRGAAMVREVRLAPEC